MGKDLNGKEIGDNITQRKDGRYVARYVDRFDKRKSIYSRNLREIKLKLNEAIYENANEINIIDENITLDVWFDKWMEVYKEHNIRQNTKRVYIDVYKNHISPKLGSVKLNEVTQLQIKNIINNLNNRGYQYETQNKVRILLTDMFNRAMEDNFVRRNPAKNIRLTVNKPNDRFVLSSEYQAEFFECSSGTFYDNLFVVAVNTGLRPGELFALTWDDIDLKKMEINVDKTLVYQKFEDDEKKTFHLGPPKTKQSVRKVPINKKAELALKKQFILKRIIERRGIKNVDYSDRLFVTKFNTPLNSVLYSTAIKKIVDELNIQKDDMEHIEAFGGHTFRHTFATRCVEDGVLPKVLQKYLGHATLQMTMDLYVHITDEYQKEEIIKLREDINVSIESIENKYQNAKKVVNFSSGVKMV